MEILTDSQLKQGLTDMIYNVRQINPTFYDWCVMEYQFGMRYNETKQGLRWALQQNNTYLFACEKGDNHRIIPVQYVPNYIQDAIANNLELWDTCRERTVQRLINYYFPYPPIRCGNRGVSTYLFRYNIIKMMHTDGYTDTQIQTYMAETDVKNIRGYYNAILHY